MTQEASSIIVTMSMGSMGSASWPQSNVGAKMETKVFQKYEGVGLFLPDEVLNQAAELFGNHHRIYSRDSAADQYCYYQTEDIPVGQSI